MDREQLRQLILDDAHKLQNSMAWRWLTGNDKKLSRAAQEFWGQNTDTTNAALDNLVTIFNSL